MKGVSFGQQNVGEEEREKERERERERERGWGGGWGRDAIKDHVYTELQLTLSTADLLSLPTAV